MIHLGEIPLEIIVVGATEVVEITQTERTEGESRTDNEQRSGRKLRGEVLKRGH